MALFKPGWMSEKRERALRSVAKLKDDGKLTSVALNAPLYPARLQAVEQIDSPAALAEVALNSQDDKIGAAAVQRLEGEENLLKAAMGAHQWKARVAAVDKLGEAASLSRVALECDSADARAHAAARLQDPATLQKIALSDKSDVVRKAAAQRVIDQATLQKLALSDAYEGVRLSAAQRVQDPETLEKVAMTDQYDSVRLAATQRVQDPAALERLALTNDRAAVRKAALERVKDEDALARVALGPDKELQQAASARLRSPKAKEYVAMNTDRWVIGENLVDRLKDREALGRIVLGAKDWSTRNHAAERIREPEQAKSLLMAYDDGTIAIKLLKRLSPEDLLDVAKGAAAQSVRMQAVELVKDDAVLEALGQSGCVEANMRLAKRRGGFACRGCGRMFLPKASETPPCVCPDCGTENHDFHHKSDLREYRDYEVGHTWDECSRCGEKINVKFVNTM